MGRVPGWSAVPDGDEWRTEACASDRDGPCHELVPGTAAPLTDRKEVNWLNRNRLTDPGYLLKADFHGPRMSSIQSHVIGECTRRVAWNRVGSGLRVAVDA